MTIHSNPSGCPFVTINQMENNAISIDLGDMHVTSPMTDEPIRIVRTVCVLPIRVPEGEAIPCRYTEVFKQLAVETKNKVYKLLTISPVAIDYNEFDSQRQCDQNIDTMTFFEGAKRNGHQTLVCASVRNFSIVMITVLFSTATLGNTIR